MDDAGQVEVLDAAEHLVEQVGHPLVVQVHVDHLAEGGHDDDDDDDDDVDDDYDDYDDDYADDNEDDDVDYEERR